MGTVTCLLKPTLGPSFGVGELIYLTERLIVLLASTVSVSGDPCIGARAVAEVRSTAQLNPIGFAADREFGPGGLGGEGGHSVVCTEPYGKTTADWGR